MLFDSPSTYYFWKTSSARFATMSQTQSNHNASAATKSTYEITIPAKIIRSNHIVTFGVGEADRAGQQYRGSTKGDDKVGDWITVRKQTDPTSEETSRVEVISREDHITGDVVLTIRESHTIAKA